MFSLDSLPRKITNNGIAYYQTGEGGVPIVLLHGVGLSADSWCYQQSFLEKNHTVYALDMPGHGKSTASASTLDEFTALVQHFVTTVVPTAPILIGHSMGAMLALYCAHKIPCLSIMTLNAIGKRDETAKNAIGKRVKKLTQGEFDIETPLMRWFGNEHLDAKNKCRQWLNAIATQNPMAYINAYRVFANNNSPSQKCLSSFKIPTMFITGSQDNNSTPLMSKQLAATTKGEAVIIQGAGHLMQLTHPNTINQLIQQFIKQTIQ